MDKPPHGISRRRTTLALLGALIIAITTLTSVAAAQSTSDPRVGLAPDATASLGMQHLANRPMPAGFAINSDLAFQGNFAFVGNFVGFHIYDISDPANPVHRKSVLCPGGQGEVSVYRNLLFQSVEAAPGRVDCGTENPPVGSPLRMRGVRIFDISNLDNPVQVATVQTCRGSHTHTLLKSPRDRKNIYVYVSGTQAVRSPLELAGCKALPPGTPLTTPQLDEELSQWRIEVIKVPLDAPQNAAVVNAPRLFRDPATGVINGLQNAPPTPTHPSNNPPIWSPMPTTDSCHDITSFPEIGLAAGACEGNGLLIDIRDPANPRRIHEVSDPNWSYWHGATFSNDGKSVVFTEEWAGGTQPRCHTADPRWGGNAIYDIVDRKLVFRSYYKLPVLQTNQENCVSHLPSLVPVPGRDIMVQAWYQGGASLIDFTDSRNPREIGYFDRGPINATSLVLGGFWSTYYYNGAVYGSEIFRGFDTFRLTPTAELSVNEIKAASEAKLTRLTPQHQPRYRWKPSFAVVGSFFDQAVRSGELRGRTLDKVEDALDKAERFAQRGKNSAAREQLRKAERLLGRRFDDLREAIDDLADSLRRGRGDDHDDDDD
jgi:LVIVD repeat